MEQCLINNEKVNIPVLLCENKPLLKSLFSLNTWNMFTEQQKNYLMVYLPTFEKDDMNEKLKTLELLFSGEEFRFGMNPLSDFQFKLHNGFYKTDIAIMKNYLNRSHFKEYKREQCAYYFDTLKVTLAKREQLLKSSDGLQSELVLYDSINSPVVAINSKKSNTQELENKSKSRFQDELNSIKMEVTDIDNVNEC